MSLSQRTIRWGILGTGYIARQFAIGLQSLPDAKLQAVASRNLETAQSFAQAFQVPQTFGSYEALVQEADVDVVYVATPHIRHHEDCLLSLQHGKAVLCEKPFAVNAVEAKAVFDLAQQQNLFCMEAMWMRFMPLVQRVKSMIQAGAIGQVVTLSADFGYPTEFDPANRFFNLDLAGGALLDRGSYGLSLAFYLLGIPAEVAGQASVGETGVDELSTVILKYANGQQAVLSATLRSFASNTATITGTQGKIVIHEPFCRPDQISITPLSEHPVVVSSPGVTNSPGVKQKVAGLVRSMPLVKSLIKQLRNPTRLERQAIAGNGFNYEAAEVMRCLRSGQIQSPVMPWDDSIQILQVMDTLRQQWQIRYPSDPF